MKDELELKIIRGKLINLMIDLEKIEFELNEYIKEIDMIIYHKRNRKELSN